MSRETTPRGDIPRAMGQRVEIVRALAKLAAAFPGSRVGQDTIDVYAQRLNHVDARDLDAAVGELIDTSERWPRVSAVLLETKAQKAKRAGAPVRERLQAEDGDVNPADLVPRDEALRFVRSILGSLERMKSNRRPDRVPGEDDEG